MWAYESVFYQIYPLDHTLLTHLHLHFNTIKDRIMNLVDNYHNSLHQKIFHLHTNSDKLHIMSSLNHLHISM